MSLFKSTCCCDPATPLLSDKGDDSVASSVTWQSNKSIAINSGKTVWNSVLHSLAVAYEGGLFSSGDLHLVWWNSFECLPPFFCPTSSVMCWTRTCRPPLVNTGTACKWNNLDSLQGAEPIKKHTCLKDLLFVNVFGCFFFSFSLNNDVDISAIIWDWYGHVHTVHTQFYVYVITAHDCKTSVSISFFLKILFYLIYLIL